MHACAALALLNNSGHVNCRAKATLGHNSQASKTEGLFHSKQPKQNGLACDASMTPHRHASEGVEPSALARTRHAHDRAQRDTCDVQRTCASGEERARQVISASSVCDISTGLDGGSCSMRIVWHCVPGLQHVCKRPSPSFRSFSHATAKTAKGANLRRPMVSGSRTAGQCTRACLNSDTII